MRLHLTTRFGDTFAEGAAFLSFSISAATVLAMALICTFIFHRMVARRIALFICACVGVCMTEVMAEIQFYNIVQPFLAYRPLQIFDCKFGGFFSLLGVLLALEISFAENALLPIS